MDRFVKVVVDTLNDVLDGIESSKCDISSGSLDLLIRLNDRIVAFIGKERARRVLHQWVDTDDIQTSEYAPSVEYSKENPLVRWGKLY